MGRKNHNVDFITDMQERADHNINPYYWFNRVTPFTLAQWKTSRVFDSFFFVFYSVMGGLFLLALRDQALREQQTFWAVVFDFSDSFSAARCVGVLFFSISWVLMAFSTGRLLLQRLYVAMQPKPKRKREKKKKYPRRPKNYR